MKYRSILICLFVVYLQACSLTPQPSEFEQNYPQLYQTLLADMILIEGGPFLMGNKAPDAPEREKPQHQVTLDNFYMSRYEVTQTLFATVMGYNDSYFQCTECPVNQVSWLVAKIFIDKLNQQTGLAFRLPTEAEWEYAAKGGQLSKGFRFSGSNQAQEVAWFGNNANRKAHPVGQKAPNELGLYDMTGNMWELCEDDFEPRLYSDKPRNNPLHQAVPRANTPVSKVVRGGGYEFDEDEIVVTRRDGVSKNVRMADIGIRLVLDSK